MSFVPTPAAETAALRRARPLRAAVARGGVALALVFLLAAHAVGSPRFGHAADPGYDWPQFDGNPQHSGDNTRETALTAGNVGGLALLRRVSLPSTEDGAPVYLSGVTTATGTQDLLFLTTGDGHILALDAHTLAPVWSHQYGPGACRINTGPAVCYTTSSPAVDPNRQYVYSYGLDGYVHKYAVGSGAEITGGGWPERATTKGFNEKESSALAIATARDGTSYLYVAAAGYPGDNGDYQGHITTVDLADGVQRVFNATCSDQAVHFVERPGSPDCPQVQTAVWGRPGVVYDPDTDKIYFSTGNGPFDANAAGAPNHDWGDSVLALSPDGMGADGGPLDSYTPGDYQSLRDNDQDIGSTSPAILPAPASSAVQHLGLQSGKDSALRLLNLDNLSGHGGPGHTDGQVGQVIPVPQGGAVLPTPAVWVNPGDGSTWVFVASYNGLSALQLTVDSSGTPSLRARWTNGDGGTSPIVANNVLYDASYGALKALDPTTGAVLWQDTTIGPIHWESPIVADGAVYLTDGNTASGGSLSEYALPASPTSTPAPPTATPIPPTAISPPIPPTATGAGTPSTPPPTATAISPPIPPTATPAPPPTGVGIPIPAPTGTPTHTAPPIAVRPTATITTRTPPTVTPPTIAPRRPHLPPPAHLTLTVSLHLAHGALTGDSSLMVATRTRPRTMARITLTLTHPTRGWTGQGHKRHVVAITQSLYRTAALARANSKGRLSATIHFGYNPTHTVQGTLTIVVHMASGTATRATRVTVVHHTPPRPHPMKGGLAR